MAQPMEVKDISPAQVKAVNVILRVRGLMEDKEVIISSFTDGRTAHISEMKMHEARQLLIAYNKPEKSNHLMLRKIIAMAHELGWIKQQTVVTNLSKELKPQTVEPMSVTNSKIETKKDYSALYGWVLKYGYLKKDLRKYSYNELPKLVSQLEFGPYKSYLSKR